MTRKHFSRFSSNSEADTPDLLENIEEMIPLYYMDSDVISRLKYSATSRCVLESCFLVSENSNERWQYDDHQPTNCMKRHEDVSTTIEER